MNIQQSNLVNPKIIKIFAAVVIGLSIGAVLPPNPIAINAIGTIPGILFASVGVSVGAMMYIKAPNFMGGKSCGCLGECSCSN